MRRHSLLPLLSLVALPSCDLGPTGPGHTLEGSVAVGRFHACRLNGDGAAFCWGESRVGQLGDGSFATRESPSKVAGRIAFQSISAGFEHTCGLDREHRVHCWGGNSRGALGDSAIRFGTFPTPAAAGLGFVAVTAGGGHTCALTRGGEAYCWGDNGSGQLGVRELPTTCGGGVCSFRAVRVSGDFTFVALTAGANHTCGLTTDGVAYCWGQNTAGQLGRPPSRLAATPLLVGGGLRFLQISAGAAHTCAITADGAAYCWGLNTRGQLGTGVIGQLIDDMCCSLGPERVAFDGVLALVNAGGEHTCALTDEGAPYCWGRNTAGQLGVGDGFDEQVPALVETSVRFQSIVAGLVNTCGVGRDGVTYCWGENLHYQLGIGIRGIRSALPMRVAVPGTGQ